MTISSVTTPSISPLQPLQSHQQNKTSPAATPAPAPTTAPSNPYGGQGRGTFLDIKI